MRFKNMRGVQQAQKGLHGRQDPIAKPKRRKPPRCLFLNTGRAECSIVDENEQPVSLEDAKALWESGNVADYNLSLGRLATMNWDYEALKAYYAKGGRP